MATLRRRPGGSQKDALGPLGLVSLWLWRLLCQWLGLLWLGLLLLGRGGVAVAAAVRVGGCSANVRIHLSCCCRLPQGLDYRQFADSCHYELSYRRRYRQFADTLSLFL